MRDLLNNPQAVKFIEENKNSASFELKMQQIEVDEQRNDYLKSLPLEVREKYELVEKHVEELEEAGVQFVLAVAPEWSENSDNYKILQYHTLNNIVKKHSVKVLHDTITNFCAALMSVVSMFNPDRVFGIADKEQMFGYYAAGRYYPYKQELKK